MTDHVDVVEFAAALIGDAEGRPAENVLLQAALDPASDHARALRSVAARLDGVPPDIAKQRLLTLYNRISEVAATEHIRALLFLERLIAGQF